MKILEMKIAMCDMESLLDDINGRLYIAEENISELGDIKII